MRIIRHIAWVMKPRDTTACCQTKSRQQRAGPVLSATRQRRLAEAGGRNWSGEENGSNMGEGGRDSRSAEAWQARAPVASGSRPGLLPVANGRQRVFWRTSTSIRWLCPPPSPLATSTGSAAPLALLVPPKCRPVLRNALDMFSSVLSSRSYHAFPPFTPRRYPPACPFRHFSGLS